MSGPSSGFTVQQVVTEGTFTLDGQSFDVANNVWVIGDDSSLLIIDAAHDAAAIAAAVAGRRVAGIICTHGHNDHINVARELAGIVTAPIFLHEADRMLWHDVYPGADPDFDLRSGDGFRVAGEQVHVLPTPGHSPGGVCLHVPGAGMLFSGDTLFRGGPGATGRSFSDFPTLLDSIRTQLLGLPPETLVHPGHGEDTTIGAEAADYDAWVARGH